VITVNEILPSFGKVPGKGEALWKSLYDTDGDLVVFVDSDLVAFDQQFVVGLLGPLLTDPLWGTSRRSTTGR
jgi:glucosyl-3-phosphoglycerate synthase